MPGVKPPAAAADAPRALQHTLFFLSVCKEGERRAAAKRSTGPRCAAQYKRGCKIGVVGSPGPVPGKKDQESQRCQAGGCARPPLISRGGHAVPRFVSPSYPRHGGSRPSHTNTRPCVVVFCARARPLSPLSLCSAERQGVRGEARAVDP